MALPSSKPGVTTTDRDGHNLVSAGQTIRYGVIVMPARAMTRLKAPDAALAANAVAWHNPIGAGETRAYKLAGRIDHAAREPSTLEMTACVHKQPNEPAVACATDRDTLAAAQKDDPGTRRTAWIGAIIFGILAVVGATWLYRKVNPELLTPATANKAAQPGGAPSD